MDDTMTEAHRIMCEEIRAIAEAKLNRRLSPDEAAAIWNISSLMMLEAIERNFSQSTTNAEDVARELAFFSMPKGAK